MMNKIYNEEIKEKFLSTYDNQGTQATLRHVFFKTFLIEDVLNKDLANFNLDQIGKCIANASPHNNQTARSIGRFISGYLDWSIEEGLRENSNINPIKGISPSWYDAFVDKKKVHYSYNEFIDLLSSMSNGQDQMFLSLIFSGLMGRSFGELRELKITDINFDTNQVYVKERDIYITIEDELMKFIEKGVNQNSYFTYNNETGEHNERPLVESSYIFKNVQSPRTSSASNVNPSVFYNRLNNMRLEHDLEYLTPNACKQSGVIYQCYLLYQEYGKLEYEEFSKLSEKYELPMVTSNGLTYLNTSLIKEYVSSENFKNLYDLDVKF